jgi:phospholipase/carboxylesterase
MSDDALIHAADYALAFRRPEPAPDAPRSLLVLLHGVGGDEHQLEHLGERVPSATLVVLPRGHRSISGGKWGWYRVGLGEDGPQIVEAEMQEARLKLIEFLAQLQAHYDIPPSRTWVAGFSQGGVLAAAAALTSPASMAGFAMASGRLLPELDAFIAERNALRHLRALLVHGRDDDVLPVEGALAAQARLEALGVRSELRLFDGGHSISGAMEDDVARWLERESTLASSQPE